jgi:hypothetical protein
LPQHILICFDDLARDGNPHAKAARTANGRAYDEPMLKLSVLDQSVVSYGQPQDAAIRHKRFERTAAPVLALEVIHQSEPELIFFQFL